jgi:transmembrane 9 superfamily protein 2/4
MHGDVFRPPRNSSMLLCVAVGTGAQLMTAIGLVLFCGFVGILSPMNKGQTLTSTIFLYVLTGSVAGYTSCRFYKYFGGTAWKRTAFLTATMFPATLVSMFLVLDILLAFQGAATAVSIWTILSLFLLWVCVSAPLVFVGSYFGYLAKKVEVPTKTNQIARVIPDAGWYVKPFNTFILGGLLPFGNVCIEVYFIMTALWLHQIYYVMGFLFAVLIVLIVTTAEMSIVLCYLQLSAEDHQWWWRSFFSGASAGFYLFVYSIWFFFTRMQLVGFLPVMIYATYMSMMSMVLALFSGAVGVLSCLWFTKTIYGAIKVD